MEGFVKDIQIAGIASCVPENTEDNMDYGNVLGEKRVKKQIRLTGIRKRHAEESKELQIWHFVQQMICLQN